MKRKITLKQIAKELDVSISTVSKSLRNSLEIGEETRLKVKAFAKFYNYKPNNIALSLKNRKTKTIGIIIPENANIRSPWRKVTRTAARRPPIITYPPTKAI